jgi:hypothetical protein
MAGSRYPEQCRTNEEEAINEWAFEQHPELQAQTVKPVTLDRSVQTTGTALTEAEYKELLRDIILKPLIS